MRFWLASHNRRNPSGVWHQNQMHWSATPILALTKQERPQPWLPLSPWLIMTHGLEAIGKPGIGALAHLPFGLDHFLKTNPYVTFLAANFCSCLTGLWYKQTNGLPSTVTHLSVTIQNARTVFYMDLCLYSSFTGCKCLVSRFHWLLLLFLSPQYWVAGQMRSK